MITVTALACTGSLLVLAILTPSSSVSAINLDDNDGAFWSYLADDSITPEHLEVLLRHARDRDDSDEDDRDENGVGSPAFKEVKEILTTAAAAEMDLGTESEDTDAEEQSPEDSPTKSGSNISEDDDVQGLDLGIDDEDEDVPILLTAVTSLDDEQLSSTDNYRTTTEGAESTTTTDDFDTTTTERTTTEQTTESENEIDTTLTPQTTETSEATEADAGGVAAKEKLVTDLEIDTNVIDAVSESKDNLLKAKTDENFTAESSTSAEIALFKEATEKPDAPVFVEEMRSSSSINSNPRPCASSFTLTSFHIDGGVVQEDCNYIVRRASDDVCELSVQFNKFSRPTVAETDADDFRGCVDVGGETFCTGDDGLTEGDIRSR